MQIHVDPDPKHCSEFSRNIFQKPGIKYVKIIRLTHSKKLFEMELEICSDISLFLFLNHQTTAKFKKKLKFVDIYCEIR